MTTVNSKISLIKNIEDPQTKKLHETANKLFKIGIGTSIFSGATLIGSELLDLFNVVSVSSKFTGACGVGIFAGILTGIASAVIQSKVEKRVYNESQEKQLKNNTIDFNS